MLIIFKEMPVAAILFFRMWLISVPEKLTPNADILQICWCSFLLRALTPKISTCGGGGVAKAKPKYPLDASGGYNYIDKILKSTKHTYHTSIQKNLKGY